MHRRLSFALISVVLCAAQLTTGCRDARTTTAGSGDTVRVAVAANFAAPHDTLAQRFHATTGIVVVPIVGATGQLYAQITNGAPVDILLSADQERPAKLEADGAAVAGSRFTYAEGQLAIYAPKSGAPIDTPDKLKHTSIRHIAIANPETAPYGTAAMQVLAKWGITDAVSARLVRGESIAQTFQFIESGAADAGFVALSQLRGRLLSAFWIVPANLHSPIAQDAVLLKRAAGNDAAKRYMDFLRGAEARTVIESFGYTVPPGPAAPK